MHNSVINRLLHCALVEVFLLFSARKFSFGLFQRIPFGRNDDDE